MLVEAQRCAGPVRCRTAYRLHDPRWKVWKVRGDAPASRRGTHVGPGELGKAFPFVVDEVLEFDARAGLKDHHLDAFLSKLIAQRSAARAGANDHHHAAVI